MTRFSSSLGVVLSLALATTMLAQSNPYPVNWKELPPPFHTPAVRNQAKVIPQPAGATLEVPPGFVVQEYMSGFVRPRFMLLGPSNEVLLADSGSRDARDGVIYLLRNGAKTPIIQGLDRPYGLAFSGNTLYVAETTSVKRYPYDPKAMRVTGPGQEIVSLSGFGQGHWTRTLLFNRDRTKLYLTVGSGSNIDLGEPAMRAALHRYNPDGTGHETVATGLRNIIGLAWYPGSDDLWAGVQERDGLGDDLVPDYLVKIREGGFYGWPIAYIGPHPEPRHKDLDTAKVKSTLYPDVLLGAHVSVLGTLFYTGQQFPEKYRGGLFLAFHGSWNRSVRTGYKIAFIPFRDRRPTSGPEDFLTGWMLAPDKVEVWGRPVGLLQMPDGSLLVSDDGGQKIWRVSYSGTAPTQAR
jgi:glucose/arabinose dehydrogenase